MGLPGYADSYTSPPQFLHYFLVLCILYVCHVKNILILYYILNVEIGNKVCIMYIKYVFSDTSQHMYYLIITYWTYMFDICLYMSSNKID